MPNFVDNNTSLPANKTDLVPIPVSALATNYVAANDYNSLSQASQDIRTVVERQVSLMSYNADPTGTSDNSAAFAAAFAGMTDGGVLHLPGINSGTTAVYKITANVTVPKNITLSFDNALISITSGHTLTINSSIAAANQQIFESSNTTPVVINSAGDKIPVQWFGAVGDGATDDTLAIQQAINAISASSVAWGGVGGLSGTIFIPTGKYNISSTLTVTNTCFFTLAGENPGSQLWWTGTSSGTPMLYLVNDYFPTIKDLLFFGNYLYPPSCAIQLAEYLAIKTTPGSTHARLLNLHLYSNPLNADGPGLVDGILWKNVDFDGNNDVSHVEDVSLQGPFTNCFNIQGGNSLAHTFINIFCEDYTDNVWNTTLGAGGSFSSYGGQVAGVGITKQNRNITAGLTSANHISLTESVSHTVATIALASGTWATTPSANDVVVIPPGSVLQGSARVPASATFGSSTSVVTVTAGSAFPAAGGNILQVQILPGSGSLTVAFFDTVIGVTLASGGSTGAQVEAAINAAVPSAVAVASAGGIGNMANVYPPVNLIGGTEGENVGSYLVTSATSSGIVMTPVTIGGTLTTVSSTPLSSTPANDIVGTNPAAGAVAAIQAGFPILIDGMDIEEANRFLTLTGDSLGGGVTFKGCRLATDYLNPDCKMFLLGGVGPVNIEGCNIEGGSSVGGNTQWNLAYSPLAQVGFDSGLPTTLNMNGNQFLSQFSNENSIISPFSAGGEALASINMWGNAYNAELYGGDGFVPYAGSENVRLCPEYNLRAFGAAVIPGYADSALLLAIATIGSAPAVLKIPLGSYYIITSITVPSNITLRFDGGILNVNNPAVLTINGTVDAPEMQIFATGMTGTVVLNGNKIFPAWFGTVTKSSGYLEQWDNNGVIEAKLDYAGNYTANSLNSASFNPTGSPVLFGGTMGVEGTLGVLTGEVISAATAPSATNLLGYSQTISSVTVAAGYWTLAGAGTLTTGVTAPDGTATASSIVTTIDGGGIYGPGPGLAITSAGIAYTVSVYVSVPSSTLPVNVYLYDDLTGLLYETSVTATTSWQRVSATGVIPTGDPLLMIITTATPGTLHLWGGQIEATPYATPYIPTPTNASVTRSLGISNISPPLGTSNALQTYNGVGAITSAINANGHLLPSQSAVSIPVAGSFAGNNSTTGFGLVASIGITGNDLAGILTFTTGGTTSSISANTALFTITLGAAYASTQFVAFCTNQTAATPLEIVGQYYCIPGGSGANFVVYSTAAITPGTSVTYSFQFMTMGAGASS